MFTTNGKVLMADKSAHKTNQKKQGKTLKEKRAQKEAKKSRKEAPIIPITGR